MPDRSLEADDMIAHILSYPDHYNTIEIIPNDGDLTAS